ncbi:MAG: helix-turn-helix domain-containing protein [Acidobacteriota bacterium]
MPADITDHKEVRWTQPPSKRFYRLRHGEGWSIRKIARHLKISRPTVRRYLQSPVVVPTARPRGSAVISTLSAPWEAWPASSGTIS